MVHDISLYQLNTQPISFKFGYFTLEYTLFYASWIRGIQLFTYFFGKKSTKCARQLKKWEKTAPPHLEKKIMQERNET